jgi:hypothetical protein
VNTVPRRLIGDPGSVRRALDATDDLVNALTIAHSAVQRVSTELSGAAAGNADTVCDSISKVRREVQALQALVEQLVRTATKAPAGD